MMALTVGAGVVFFTFDPESKEFLLTKDAIAVAADTKEYAINASNQRHWEEPVKRYVDELLAGKTGPREKDFNMRWVACMVVIFTVFFAVAVSSCIHTTSKIRKKQVAYV